MRFPFILVLILVLLPARSQDVNETIKLQLSQPPLMRINAGDDLNLTESGLGVIGQSLSVSGGSPEFSYEWMDESGNKIFEKTPEVDQPGQYWLTVTDQNNCWATDSLTVMDYGTGLNREAFYPAETVRIDDLQKIITIDIPEVYGQVRITVLSVDGKIIYTFSGLGSQNTFHHRIDLGESMSGIYFLDIQHSGIKSAMKFIL